MFDRSDWPARIREISADMTEDLDDFDDAPGSGFHACPCCHGTGYEVVAEDEVAPCTHPDHDDAAFRAGHYGLSRAEYRAMYERQQVELDGWSWNGRKRSPWYRGYEG